MKASQCESVPATAGDWYVYVLSSETIGDTYVGISTDVPRRLAQHNGERPGGARSTRRGRPWHVLGVSIPLASRSAALKLEYRVKASVGVARVAALRCDEGARDSRTVTVEMPR